VALDADEDGTDGGEPADPDQQSSKPAVLSDDLETVHDLAHRSSRGPAFRLDLDGTCPLVRHDDRPDGADIVCERTESNAGAVAAGRCDPQVRQTFVSGLVEERAAITGERVVDLLNGRSRLDLVHDVGDL
jgi:hypothetical protein